MSRPPKHSPQCVARKKSGLGGCWCHLLSKERLVELWREAKK